jgi:hypothetical protein
MSLPDEARLEQQPIAQVSARGGCVAAWDAAFDVFTAHDWTLVREHCPVELLDVDWSALSRCAMAEEREVLRRVCLRTLVSASDPRSRRRSIGWPPRWSIVVMRT